MNKTRLWDHLISIGMANTFFALGHNLAPFREPMLDTTALLVGMSLWGIGVTGVKRQDRAGQDEPAAPAERLPVPDLNQTVDTPSGWIPLRHGVKLEYRTVGVQEKKLDPRIWQWAWAVTYENTPMTQAKWAGKGKPFSKPGYVAFIHDMLKDRHITLKNPKDPKSTYKANGAAGRKYIKDLADKRAYRPFPTLEKTETDLQFLRAQVSRTLREGEGRDEGA